MKPILIFSCQRWVCPAAQDTILNGKYSHTFKVQESQKLHYGVHDVALRQGPIKCCLDNGEEQCSGPFFLPPLYHTSEAKEAD